MLRKSVNKEEDQKKIFLYKILLLEVKNWQPREITVLNSMLEKDVDIVSKK